MVKSKRTYTSLKEYGHDLSYENERKHDNVHSPSHYKHGKKETIEVIQDCMTDDEYHGYLKGNVLKYVSKSVLNICLNMCHHIFEYVFEYVLIRKSFLKHA